VSDAPPILVATGGGRTLGPEAKREFAYELALGYYTDDELRRKFKLIPTAFAMYKASEEIALMKLDEQRKIDESDHALKLIARRATRTVLEENIKLLRDPDANAKTRMAAGAQIRELAEGVDRVALKDATASGGAVIIHTNLAMEGQKGVYQVTAKEIDAQLAENRELAAANSAEARVAAEDAELLALIGE
jgi:hypothetical protein